MAKTSPVSKLTKVGYMSTGIILGSMVGGAVLASAGWWYADRLDLGYGETIDVNEVKSKGGDCQVGSTGTNTYTDEDGNVVTQKVECQNDGSNIERLKLTKTRRGYKLEALTTEAKVTRGGQKNRPYEETITMVKTLWGSGPRWKVTEEKKVKLRQDLKNEVERRK